MPDDNLLDELAAVASAAAQGAAAILGAGRRPEGRQVATKSSATDMVTEVDRAAEADIASTILSVRPDDGLLGEEGTSRPGSSGVRWVVDPLDGTTNYLYGFPSYGVSVAAEIDGRVEVGVVIDVAQGETFSAVRGRGAHRDGLPLTCSGVDSLAMSLVGTGFSYHAAHRAQQAEVLVQVLPRVRDIRRAGAAAIDLCWVACGRLDAFYEEGLQPWDGAAGGLVALEAGAVLEVGPSPHPPRTLTVAAAPGIAAALDQLLGEAGARPRHAAS